MWSKERRGRGGGRFLGGQYWQKRETVKKYKNYYEAF
jgi:hypothetical protein